MKLTQLMKENEERPLSNEVKRHFLEIVSTYNKYQESMDRKSDIIKVAETLGGITEAARTLAIKEAGDWFDKHTVKRNMSELDKLGKQFDKVALEARALDQRMGGLYEDMGHILSRYYKFGEITEDEMKNRLGIKESSDPCGCGGGCGCGKSVNEVSDSAIKQIIKKKAKGGPYTVVVQSGNYDKHITHGKDVGNNIDKAIKVYHQFKKKHRVGVQIIDGYGKTVFFESVNEEAVKVSNRNSNGSITTTIKEVTDLNEQEMKLYEFGVKVEKLMEKSCPTDKGKWAASKAAAKKKFKVYPSAYANGWAAKNYKGKGGGWRDC